MHQALALLDAGAPPQVESPSDRAAEIRMYLDRTLDRRLSLRQIARELGMSVTMLQDRFRTAFGETVGEYRRRQRLLRAHAALREDGSAVATAARIAGYGRPTNLATAFARQFGYPPSQARR